MKLRLLHRAVSPVSAFLFAALALAVPASAQTIELNESHATVLRGGSYADKNLSKNVLLATRASDNPEYDRRIVLKFDTHNEIAKGASIASATLTLTVAGGNDESRTISAYRIPNSYDQPQATWNRRYSDTRWSDAGGDFAEKLDTATVRSSTGSRVTFDVTALVQGAVNSRFGSSRYSRIALVDAGGSSRASYKQYYSDEAADASVRPTLTVTLGSGSTSSPAPAPTPAPTPAPSQTSSGVQLRVLMWNIHHGVGTDGRYDINRLASWMVKMTPDVIMLNEVEKYTGWGNENQPARFKSLLEQKTGRRWYAHFAQEFGNWSSSGKGHLILSKYAFDDTGYAEITSSDGLRGAGAISQARITVNGRTLNLLLTHLDPYSRAMRLIQARDAISWASGFAQNRILGGDMNAWPDQSSIAEINKTYKDSWTEADRLGKATAASGISPFGATKKGRIDYIFFSKYAPNLVVLGSKVYDTRNSSGVMPSDHRPVVTTFLVK